MKITKRQLKRIIKEEKRKLMEVTPGQQMPNLEMDLGEAVLDLLYMELEASELDTQDPAVAKAIHGALDYAKSHFRY